MPLRINTRFKKKKESIQESNITAFSLKAAITFLLTSSSKIEPNMEILDPETS